jgi:CheY-like chemotaxis protein
MSKNIVADFTAFLSVTTDEETLFETREGRVVMTREHITFAGEDEKQKLPIDAVAEFDFRTVPPEWEQFFDDLVGVRFEDDGEEYIVTIGTDTEIADRFVTVLLKLVLDESDATVRQRLSPLAENVERESVDEETTLTLLPKREQISFDHEDVRSIDISTVTGVEAGNGDGIVVRHLCAEGRLGTEVTAETARNATFLRTYLSFRSEITSGAGPVQFLFVGDDRDALVLVAKLLKHRNLSFEAAHATNGQDALDTLDAEEVPMECVVSEYELEDMTADELRDQLSEAGQHAPMVCVTRNDREELDIPESPDIVDVVEIGSRTEHYEDIADAIEHAVITARVE